MRHLLMAAAVSGTALFAGLGAANAQLAIETPAGGVYVGPAYSDRYYYDYYEPGPRAYGYYEYDRGYGTRARERYSDRQRCGRGSHWDGQQCVAGYRD
jgi:hypothetical protein